MIIIHHLVLGLVLVQWVAGQNWSPSPNYQHSRLYELAKIAKVSHNVDTANLFANRWRENRGVRAPEATTSTSAKQTTQHHHSKTKKKNQAKTTTEIPKEEVKTAERQTLQYQQKFPIPVSDSPTAATTANNGEPTPKPTKYHYYPHNQHIYLLPECAIQQVCNAVYTRLNYTQPLCACPSRKEPCSASINADDQHTTALAAPNNGKVLTLVKTCEPVTEMRMCRAPRDWSLLALQNIRTGKSHYLVICRCPDNGRLEGPMSHDQPAYASVPGIRVYGMMCVRDTRRVSRRFRSPRDLTERRLPMPWEEVQRLASSIVW